MLVRGRSNIGRQKRKKMFYYTDPENSSRGYRRLEGQSRDVKGYTRKMLRRERGTGDGAFRPVESAGELQARNSDFPPKKYSKVTQLHLKYECNEE